MNRKTLIAISAAAFIGLGAVASSATVWAKDKGHGHGGERMVKRLTKMLSLDEGQVDALKALQTEVSETREMMHSSAAGSVGDLTELVSAETFDQQRALDTINARISAVQTNAPDLVNAAAVFFDGLSAEQKATLNEKIEKMESRRGHRGGKH